MCAILLKLVWIKPSVSLLVRSLTDIIDPIEPQRQEITVDNGNIFSFLSRRNICFLQRIDESFIFHSHNSDNTIVILNERFG